MLTVIGCVQYHSEPIISRGSCDFANLLCSGEKTSSTKSHEQTRTKIPLTRDLTYQAKRYYTVKCKHYLEVVVYYLLELQFCTLGIRQPYEYRCHLERFSGL
jgi:hypothetical protein